MLVRKFINRIERSLLIKLLIIILFTNIVVSIAFNLISYYRTQHLLESNAKESLQLLSSDMATTIDAYFYHKGVVVKQLASYPAIQRLMSADVTRENVQRNSSFNDAMASLNACINTDEDIGLTWVTNASGNFYIASNNFISAADWDMTLRPWYSPCSKIINEDRVWYSNPITSSTLKKPTIMIIKPIFNQGKIVGYAGINVLLDAFPKIMNQFPKSYDKKNLLLSSDGAVVFSDFSSLQQNRQLLQNDELKGIAQDMVMGLSRLVTANFEGDSYFVYNMHIPLTDWSVATFMNKNVISNQILSFNSISLLTILVSIVFLGILLTIVLRSSLRDIPIIIKGIKKITFGDYHTRIEAHSNNEIGQIAAVVNIMTSELDDKMQIIENYAYTDLLTGLPNRRVFLSNLNESLHLAKKQGAPLAVCFLDIDDFKLVNDTLGHTLGDDLLQRFADVLLSVKRDTDMIARFGGDEFVILMPGVSSETEVLSYFEKAKKRLTKPLSVLGKELYLRYSVGVSFFPDDALLAEDLIKNCDMAMYKAKERGKNAVEFYDAEIHLSVMKKSKLGQALNSAMDLQELYLNYQPIINASDSTVHGFEVLVRWKNAELGIVSPAEFIPIAEQTGAIIPIGTWILETACVMHKQFMEIYGSDINISVNISPMQLKQENFLRIVKDIIERTGIAPPLLQLEITESVLINFTDNAGEILQKLCNLGITIALDDFGTGYSSLSYLKAFPISCLKIDKSFIDEIHSNKKDYAMAGSIINLVHNLAMVTVAEGVETKEQYDSLKELHCDLIQGYYLGKPLDEQAAKDFLKEYKPR